MSTTNRRVTESTQDWAASFPQAQEEMADQQPAKRSSPLLLGLLPIGVLLMGFFLVPLSIMVLYSFWRVEGFNVIPAWTLDNYAKFFILPAYVRVLVRTFITSAAVTVIALIVGYPFAYFLVRYMSRRWQGLFLVLVILPFWTSYLLRVYAWMSILGDKGLINQSLMFLHVIDEPIRVFLYNQYAVVIVFLYLYLPFAILTLYASLEKFDFTQMNAAADLGATPWQAFRSVLLPQTKAGVITAFIFIFIPMLGEYITPKLVGGSSGFMIANLVVNLFRGFQFPQGSAITFVVVFCIIVFLIVSQKYLRIEELYRR
jgi:ABC-type spermidine/putrescine transport system permease subunit I